MVLKGRKNLVRKDMERMDMRTKKRSVRGFVLGGRFGGRVYFGTLGFSWWFLACYLCWRRFAAQSWGNADGHLDRARDDAIILGDKSSRSSASHLGGGVVLHSEHRVVGLCSNVLAFLQLIHPSDLELISTP
jgi:hypothetical protein